MSLREWAVLLAIIAVSLAIVAGNTYLPMNDASSHLATGLIAYRLLQGDAFTAAHYRFDALPLPYWGTTLGLLPLIPVLGPFAALHALLAIYIVALPASFYFLCRTAAPDNVRLTPVAALAVFNWAYWRGEIHTLLAQPLILLGLALFLRIRRLRSPEGIGFLAVCVGMYLCHVFAVVTLLIVVGTLAGLDLARQRVRGLEAQRLVPGQWAAAGCVVALVALAAYYVLLQHGSGANQGSVRFSLSPWKLAYFMGVQPLGSPADSNRFDLDAALTLGFAGLLAALLLLPRVRGVRLPLLAPALALAAIVYFGPLSVETPGGAEHIGLRFVSTGFLLALVAVRLTPLSRTAGWVLMAGILVFSAFKLGEAWSAHRAADEVFGRLSRNLLATIPERSRVLPIKDLPKQRSGRAARMIHRLVNYVVIERESYSPHVFAATGQQPLRHVRWGDHRDVNDRSVSEDEWAYYDYVLVQTDQPQLDIAGLAARAALVGFEDGFQLYRIRGR